MDSEPFDEFYRATSRRLLQYAYAMCGDLGVAQDITQEAYIRAWQRWSKVRDYDRPESWLRLVVFRLITDRWRTLGVSRRAAARLRPLDPVAPPSENGILLADALRRIPVRQRQVVVMYYLMDLPVAEVASEIGASSGTVKSWLSRGRASLAEALSTDGATGTESVHTETRRTEPNRSDPRRTDAKRENNDVR